MGLVWDREAAVSAVSWRGLAAGRPLVRVTRGRYLAPADAEQLHPRCAAVLAAVPHAACSHWTALALHELPVPAGGLELVHVTVRRGTTEPRRAGVRSHVCRGSLKPVAVGNLAVLTPCRSWCDVAAAGAELVDLVAAGDALWRAQPTAADDIHRVLDGRPGGRGTVRARQALELLDDRAESPMESRLRVLLVLAGLPPTAVNAVVRHSRTGAFLARVDLLYAETRVAVEYDGDHHRDRAQWQRDLLRRERLEADGWSVVVLTARDVLGDPDGVIRRVRTRVATSR